MKKISLFIFGLLLLVGCQNNGDIKEELLYDWPDEAVIGIEQLDDFAKDIKILGQHASNTYTYYYVFEGTIDENTEWFVAEVAKDTKATEQWYVKSSIGIGHPSEYDENVKSGTDDYIASLILKKQILQDNQIIIQTTDDEYNVLLQFEKSE